MTRLIPFPFGKKATPHCIQELPDLVERIEKAMRPLSETGQGPEHERVRELHSYLATMGTGKALERARRAVLYEILSPVLQACHGPKTDKDTTIFPLLRRSKRNG
jgi:hypothetical protein